MKSIWNETIEIEKRSQLAEDLDVDVLVIGGGMAGILTGYFLKKQGLNVVVLEATRIGDGQTGKTTAKITSQHGMFYKKLKSDFGLEKARQYAQYNQEAIEDYSRIIEEEGIDCDFQRLPSFLYSLRQVDMLKAEAKAAADLGINAAFTTETELPYPIAAAVKFENQAQFHPLKFIKALAEKLIIYEQSRVLRVKLQEAQTENHTVRARHIVFATHYPFVNRPGYFFIKMHQQRSYVLALKNAMQLQGMYYGVDKDNHWSLRCYKDLLLLGGVSHRTGVMEGGSPEEQLTWEASKRWPHCTEYDFWSAQDCMTIDTIPYIGRYSRIRPNWYVATGFEKWGMSTSMVAARLLTEQIVGNMDSKDTIFHPGRFKASLSLPSVLRETAATAKHFGRGITEDIPRCKHLGCGLVWNAEDEKWECPCHGSRFDKDGSLIDNPAQEGLQNEIF